jgi:hypothetical protein
VEQRTYLRRALESLNSSPLAGEVQNRLNEMVPKVPSKLGFENISNPSTVFDTEHFVVGFDAQCGAISYLKDKRTGRRLAGVGYSLGLFRYQTFSQADYDRFLSQYLTSRPTWAVLDFSKPGIAEAGAESSWWVPALSQLVLREDGEPSLLNFNNRQPSLKKGMHFNLYNNVWGTNFRMWYDEDARFRFALSYVARPSPFGPDDHPLPLIGHLGS